MTDFEIFYNGNKIEVEVMTIEYTLEEFETGSYTPPKASRTVRINSDSHIVVERADLEFLIEMASTQACGYMSDAYNEGHENRYKKIKNKYKL